MRRVVWSTHAHEDFRDIIAYIANDDPAVAARVDRTIRTLAATPTGQVGRVTGTYEKAVGGLPTIVAYALGGEPRGSETITILRIIHGARDWPDESWPD